ncbi:MAG: WYL domain-containing protein [Desulfovibrio sp.]|nr:WYL domain-containing protein [Desulfovibrio sp.]
MKYNELIKNFATIREYLRDFYIFGFRSRKEFTRNSARKYDNERRRAENWLRGVMSFHATASGKSFFISADSRIVAQNPLHAAFKNKSFTDYDISLHFYLLDALADGKEHSLKMLAESIADKWQCAPGVLDVPDDATIRNKLNEYVTLGLLHSRKEKRSLLYSLSTAMQNMDGYLDAISFAAEALPLGVIGSFLLDAHGYAPRIFSFKHRYLLGVLDSEILLALIECVNRKLYARITRRAPKHDTTVQELIFPLRFYHGTQSGRDYLFAWSVKVKQMRVYRLDRIIRVASAADTDPDVLAANLSKSRLEAMAADLQKNLWGVAFGKKPSTATLQRLSMTVYAAPDEGHIVQRLFREKRCGLVTQTGPTSWRFDAVVYDALELLPWLRTFVGRITALTCSSPEVARRFHDDLQAMLQLYGEVGDALP